MIKITVCFAVLVLGIFLGVQGQTRRPDLREVCRRQNDRCLGRESRNGRTNEVTTIFNNHCRQHHRNWQNVTRCELARANCHLTLVSCAPLTCANVRRSLGGSGGPSPNPATTTRGGRPTPPTRRTPTTRRVGPPTTRRPRRTTPGIPPDPATTRRGRPSPPPRRTTTRRSRRTTPGIPETQPPNDN